MSRLTFVYFQLRTLILPLPFVVMGQMQCSSKSSSSISTQPEVHQNPGLMEFCSPQVTSERKGVSQNKPYESPVDQEEVCAFVLTGRASRCLKTRVKKLSPTKSFCSHLCLQLLETAWSQQVRGDPASTEKPLPSPLGTPKPGKWEILAGNPGTPDPSRRPDGEPIGSPLILLEPSPGQRGAGQGSPDASSPPSSLKGKPGAEGTPRHHGGGNTRRGPARGPRRMGTPRALTPLRTRARPVGPEELRSRPVGPRASAIHPPYSRPARTPRRPGAGEGGGASSGAGGRKRGGRKMARSARA